MPISSCRSLARSCSSRPTRSARSCSSVFSPDPAPSAAPFPAEPRRRLSFRLSRFLWLFLPSRLLLLLFPLLLPLPPSFRRLVFRRFAALPSLEELLLLVLLLLLLLSSLSLLLLLSLPLLLALRLCRFLRCSAADVSAPAATPAAPPPAPTPAAPIVAAPAAAWTPPCRSATAVVPWRLKAAAAGALGASAAGAAEAGAFAYHGCRSTERQELSQHRQQLSQHWQQRSQHWQQRQVHSSCWRKLKQALSSYCLYPFPFLGSLAWTTRLPHKPPPAIRVGH